MGWKLLCVLVAICPHMAAGSVDQVATVVGMWSKGRLLQTTYHYKCTLDVDTPADYVSLTIKGADVFQTQTWDLELIEERISGPETVLRYQTLSTAYPPRYEAHFHVTYKMNFATPVTCSWEILDAPLVPVTSAITTTEALPFTTDDVFYEDEIYSGFKVTDACGYYTSNFGTDLPPAAQPTDEFGPRRPVFEPPSLRGRKKRRFEGASYPEVNYTHALDISLSFFDLQRSGPIRKSKLPTSEIPWVQMSGLNHVTPDGRNLIGGWYNGNDAVKINLPIAYSVHMLGWGYFDFGEVYDNVGLTENLMFSLEWALDYLLKCWIPEENRLYVQVGDLETDRAIWERFDSATNDDMTMTFYQVTEDSPGSDVAAEMATAFALGSLNVEDPEYSTTLLNASKSLYAFARKNRGIATVGNPNADYPSYKSTEDQDDLCVAAMWIYSIDFEESYLNQAIKYFKRSSTSTADSRLFSWDNKFVECAIHLHYETFEEKYRKYVLDYLDAWVNGPVDADGFPDVGKPVSLQYIVNAAWIGLIAIDYGIVEDTEFANQVVTWSIKNINRILGWNPDEQSFLIGYSDRSPRNPHHKNSACPNLPESCGWDFYNSVTPNTNPLTGALVGGPAIDGTYTDSRQNKLGNSVTVDYNAGLNAVLAGLQFYKDNLRKECAAQIAKSPPTIPSIPPTTTLTVKTSTDMRTRYTTPLPSAPPPMPTTFNYSDAVTKSLMFYMAQRGGEIPDDYPVTWRNTKPTFSFLPVPDRGGWFDDGSNVKTTVTMASAATLLGLGAVKYKTGFEQSDQLADLRGVLRVALNYLMDCDNGDGTIVQKNMDEVQDRAFWTRPGDSMMSRQKMLYSETQYADIVAGVSAALALGSQVFKDIDSSYSATLLDSSVNFYRYSQVSQGSYNDTDSVYYSNPGDAADEKCIAAVWLFRATGDSAYIATIINSYVVVRQTELSWTNQHVLCQILLYETTGQMKYRDAIMFFLRHWMDSGVPYTPQGLAWYRSEGTLRYSANAAFASLLAADVGITPSKSRSWAKSQIDYMLGKNSNAFSYLIGYGDRFPRRPYHRGSSCPNNPDAPCDWSVINSPKPNPNVLIGALVSGPDLNDFHEDQRTNQIMNRVAVDYNAGFTAAAAGLIELFPATTPQPSTRSSSTATTTTTTTTTTTPKPTTTYKPPTTKTTKTPVPPSTVKVQSTSAASKEVPSGKQPETSIPSTAKPSTSTPSTSKQSTTKRPSTTQLSGQSAPNDVNSSPALKSSLSLVCVFFMVWTILS